MGFVNRLAEVIRDPSRLRRSRGERGSGALEYTVLVAVLAVPTTASVQYLHDAGAQAMESAAVELGGTPPPDGKPTSTTEPGPGSTTTSTTTPPPNPTTTTTTTPRPNPTTTTTPAKPASASFSDPSVREYRNQRWSASTELSLETRDGSPVANAKVEVLVRYQSGKGSSARWDEERTTVETDDHGRVTIGSEKVRLKGAKAVSRMEFSVLDVDADGHEWDGWGTKVSVDSP